MNQTNTTGTATVEYCTWPKCQGAAGCRGVCRQHWLERAKKLTGK